MTTSKAAGGGETATTLQPAGQECCMCGDLGLSSELFRCKVCQFRSQHRYCSNLYPKAEAYRLCNWCLSKKELESEDKTQNSFNSSSSNRTVNTSDHQDDVIKTTKKKNVSNHGGLKKGSVKLHDIKNSIKKQRSPERLPLLAARKRITTTTTTTSTDAMEDKLRRTKSEEISNNNGGKGMIRKPVFRNKVRRYKLLDEVSSL